jgi:hypothetical protein
MKLLRNVSVKISFQSLQIALVPPSWSTVLFHHVFCSGLFENVDYLRRMWKLKYINPHALFSRAFEQRFYINLWAGLLGNRVVCLQ